MELELESNQEPSLRTAETGIMTVVSTQTFDTEDKFSLTRKIYQTYHQIQRGRIKWVNYLPWLVM